MPTAASSNAVTALLVMVLVGILPGSARAGDVYLNGVRAESLRDVELKGVTVRIDQRGDIWITAPDHVVQVDGRTAPPTPGDVPRGHFWLVTEDNASADLSIEVVINGTLIRTVRSGDAQLILDLAPYLKSGPNTILVNAPAGRQPSGGPMRIYVGTGRNENGTVVLDNPEISFTRRANEATEATSRTWTLEVR